MNLRGSDPGAPPLGSTDALRGLLDALEVPPQHIPAELSDQSAMFRSLLAGRRMLLLIDNASDANQVRPLLPGRLGCLVLVTSRGQLPPWFPTTAPWRSPSTCSPRPRRKPARAPRGSDRIACAEPYATGDIITLCGRVPLALAIAAAGIAGRPHVQLATVAEEIRGEHDAGAGDPSAPVQAVFGWSYAR